MNALPKCACGCGQVVKSPGRKLASRRCIGAYNANKKEEPPALVQPVQAERPSNAVLEECIRLARSIPRNSREEFFQRVVDLVNLSEDLVPLR